MGRIKHPFQYGAISGLFSSVSSFNRNLRTQVTKTGSAADSDDIMQQDTLQKSCWHRLPDELKLKIVDYAMLPTKTPHPKSGLHLDNSVNLNLKRLNSATRRLVFDRLSRKYAFIAVRTYPCHENHYGCTNQLVTDAKKVLGPGCTNKELLRMYQAGHVLLNILIFDVVCSNGRALMGRPSLLAFFGLDKLRLNLLYSLLFPSAYHVNGIELNLSTPYDNALQELLEAVSTFEIYQSVNVIQPAPPSREFSLVSHGPTAADNPIEEQLSRIQRACSQPDHEQPRPTSTKVVDFLKQQSRLLQAFIDQGHELQHFVPLTMAAAQLIVRYPTFLRLLSPNAEERFRFFQCMLSYSVLTLEGLSRFLFQLPLRDERFISDHLNYVRFDTLSRYLSLVKAFHSTFGPHDLKRNWDRIQAGDFDVIPEQRMQRLWNIVPIFQARAQFAVSWARMMLVEPLSTELGDLRDFAQDLVQSTQEDFRFVEAMILLYRHPRDAQKPFSSEVEIVMIWLRDMKHLVERIVTAQGLDLNGINESPYLRFLLDPMMPCVRMSAEYQILLFNGLRHLSELR